MKIKKYIICGIIVILLMNILTPKISEPELRNWVKIAKNFHDDFFYTNEAKRIGDNCLIYQDVSGGFPKNYYIPDIMNNKVKDKIRKAKLNNCYVTIDNSATITEIIYLSKLYKAQKDNIYKNSALKGINFLLDSQYDNGGFPQKPKRKSSSYELQISYNDNAMINVLKLIKKISEKTSPFEYVDDLTAQKAKTKLNKGIDCIIKTQIKQNGKLTTWSQHYDKNTLKPCKGRMYELPAINGGEESTNIVLFLMSLDNPSQEVKNSVEGAIEWFEKSKITNKKIKIFVNKQGKNDVKIVTCKSCPPLWARYYDIETNRPFFVTRKSEIKYNLEEIPYERRIGYEWYGYYPQKALDAYKVWKYRKHK